MKLEVDAIRVTADVPAATIPLSTAYAVLSANHGGQRADITTEAPGDVGLLESNLVRAGVSLGHGVGGRDCTRRLAGET